MKWQPIKTRPIGGFYLVGGWLVDTPGSPETWEVNVAWCDDEKFYSDFDVNGEPMEVMIDRVTHWMPIPPPPRST